MYGILMNGALIIASYGMVDVAVVRNASKKYPSCCGAQKKIKSGAKEISPLKRSKTMQDWKEYCDTHDAVISLDPDSLNLVQETDNADFVRTEIEILEDQDIKRTRQTEDFERMKKMAYRMLREEATKGLLFYVLRQEPQQVLAFIGDGAFVNVKDGIKWTPLHYAARDRHVEIAKILLAVRGIDTTIVNGSGHTAEQVVLSRRDCATEEHQKLCNEILGLLRLHQENRYPYAIYNRQLITVEELAQIVAHNSEDSSNDADQPHVTFK